MHTLIELTPLGRTRHCRGASSTARRAGSVGEPGRVDRYVSCVRSLTRGGTFVFLTDSAVGSKEEDNLRHLVINLGVDVPRSSVVPFLTCKHPLDYCLAYADRARDHGFEALVVLGGDKSVGPARCVEHAWQLREQIRAARARSGARRMGQPARECRSLRSII